MPQVASANRLATSQIDHFNSRLEQLHNEDDRRHNSIDLQIGLSDGNEPLAYVEQRDQSQSSANLRFSSLAGEAANGKTGAGDGQESSKVAFWAGGYVNFGQRDNGSIDIDQTLVGVSAGVDYRFSPTFIGGVGVGFGLDVSEVGSNGTENTARGFSTAICGSYNPAPGFFIDGLIGYSWLDMDSRRFVTGSGDFAIGQRDGHQVFGSMTASYDYRQDQWRISPYGRLDAAWTRLEGFTETGAGAFNLAFSDQDVTTLTGVLGVRGEYSMPMSWGVLTPHLRLEYNHEFATPGHVAIGYSARGGFPYGLTSTDFDRDGIELGLGLGARLDNAWGIDFEYNASTTFDSDHSSHTISLRLGRKF